jgi:hypothetical protein
MGENQCQDKTTLLQQKIFPNVGHAHKQRRGQCKRKRKFAQARGLVRIESIALAGEVTECEDKEDGS